MDALTIGWIGACVLVCEVSWRLAPLKLVRQLCLTLLGILVVTIVMGILGANFASPSTAFVSIGIIAVIAHQQRRPHANPSAGQPTH